MSLRIVLRPKVIDHLKPLAKKGHHCCQQTPARSYHRSRSMVPYIMREMIRDLEKPLYDQHFGQGLRPSRLLDDHFSLTPLLSGYLRPWRFQDWEDSGVSNIVNSKDCFKVSLDVQQFKPEELTVKVVDNFVVVEGKHEERSDEHGLVSRHFSRRYQLPVDVDVESLQSSLTSDGVLQLLAVKKPESEKDVRTIPITRNNTPAAAVNPDEGNKPNEETQEKPKSKQ